MLRQSGTVVVEIVVVLALIGGATFFAKNMFGKKDRERAEMSVDATEALLAAGVEQGEEIAASVTAIGTANAEAPESPSKAFITREVPVTLSMLPEASESALKAAEQRRMAVMEGRLHEANRLYVDVFEKAQDLQRQLDAAIFRRKQADEALVVAAQARSDAMFQRTIYIAIGALAFVLYFLRSSQSITLPTMGRIVSGLRAGDGIAAVDEHLPQRFHKHVSKHAKLNAQQSDELPTK